MYTCPECGNHNVTVKRLVHIIEYWTGEDVDSEEDLSYAREESDGTISCNECGCEGESDYEWYTPF